VTGCATHLEGAAVTVRCVMQKIVALLVMEAKTMSAVTCAQDMLYARKVIMSLGLKVKLPMILDIEIVGLLICLTTGAQEVEQDTWKYACFSCAI
jgi:hypothetical protein